MVNEIIKGFKFAFGFFLFLGVLFGIVYAIGFHSADEILGGTFLGNYVFSGNVEINNLVLNESSIICVPSYEGSLRYNKTLKGVEVCNGTSWKGLVSSSNLCSAELLDSVFVNGATGSFIVDTDEIRYFDSPHSNIYTDPISGDWTFKWTFASYNTGDHSIFIAVLNDAAGPVTAGLYPASSVANVNSISLSDSGTYSWFFDTVAINHGELNNAGFMELRRRGNEISLYKDEVLLNSASISGDLRLAIGMYYTSTVTSGDHIRNVEFTYC